MTDDIATPPTYDDVLARARDERWVERLHARDASLWSSDPDVQATIAERLGWLDAPIHFHEEIGPLEAFGEAARDAGYRSAVVAGMGGSSLAPDVLRRTFGDGGDWLTLRILDSTDPAAVAATVDDLTRSRPSSSSPRSRAPPPSRSPSRPTPGSGSSEPLAATHQHEAHPGDFMILVTDPERSLQAIPHHDEVREVFLNPPDIGGRYAALTYVGLLPASLIGLDLDPLLGSARKMLDACHAKDPATNPGFELGLTLGVQALAGRDKLTFVADPEIAAFGAWAEQLVAESTGKHGVGIVPIDLEPLGEADRYGPDRLFVRLALADSSGPAPAPDGTTADDLLAALEAAGHPVIRIALDDPMDLGGEFVRWEIATAVAGAVLGIDPFDQPNVEEAKEHTRTALARHDDGGGGGSGDAPRRRRSRPTGRIWPSPCGPISPHSGRTATRPSRRSSRRPTNAIARSPGLRLLLRDATRRATTAGYGPRFLHSTGQLHKGGAPIGWFLQLTADHPQDRPIPGKPYTFGELIDAQAAGDLAALRTHHLPVLRVHLGPDPDAGLAALEAALAIALLEGLRDHAHRVHRSRPDGGQHGPPASSRRARGGRLQPDRREDPRDRRRGRDPGLQPRGAGRQARGAPGGLGDGPGRRRDAGPDRASSRSSWPRATRSSTAATRTSTTTSVATPSWRRDGHPLRRRRHERRDLGPGQRLLPDGRRGGRRGRAARADLPLPGARRTATSTSADPAPGTT